MFASKPYAQTVCIDRTEMLDRLAAEYGEHLAEVRMTKDRRLMEILISPTHGTWTVLLTKANGVSCIIAVGEELFIRAEVQGPGI